MYQNPYHGVVRSPRSIIGRPDIREALTRSNPYRTTSPQRARQIALSKTLRPRFSTVYERNALGHPLITGWKEQTARRRETHRKRRKKKQQTRTAKRNQRKKRNNTLRGTPWRH